MNYWKLLVAVVSLGACGVVVGQEASNQGMAAQRALDEANRRAVMSREESFRFGNDQAWKSGMISLATARKSLAKEWEKLGLSPEMATTVANTYRADSSSLLSHPPLEGRSDKEVSGMIQQALVSKNYRMANQLLIDFERKKLHAEPVSSKPPSH
ncbi:hypothetical protein [Dyella lutea]|uniref:Uncharacterized protein n=1 Tax=Dyella lutea TaxID=2950441 RepID=A0ABT1F7E2_9GAMM|nr:hypothetical protein [Dyella lutea]MCP1373302.1 hypothetical protein [Dyella lutea]